MAKPKCHKCEDKCGKGKVHPDVIAQLETGFRELLLSDSKSMLKKYLTQQMFDKLKTMKTPMGCTLLDCIRSGLENFDSGIGIYAADPDSYTVFSELFDRVIQDYHGFRKSERHPAMEWGNLKSIQNIDPKGDLVVSTRIRCCRMLEGYPFSPCLTEDQYKEIEAKMVAALNSLKGDLKGTYYPLSEMTPEVQQQLVDEHFLFKEGDKFLQSAQACRFWPTSRGIFYNNSKTFLVWVNEEDHVRIISLQQGGNLAEVYKRFVSGVTELENKVKFMKTERFGNLTFCPTNLGTSIRASVHIKVPKLAKNMAQLEQLAEKFNLQVRGSAGEHSTSSDGVYDISNKRRLGLTEYQVIKEMYDGILEIMKLEKAAK